MTRQSLTTIQLEIIQIANPCTASWDKMHGDERVRFCEECKLHVYDLSAMSRREATELVAQHEGRLCVQMYRRADGTVITDDCGPIRRIARRSLQFAGRAANLVLCAALPLPIFASWLQPITRWISMHGERGEVASHVAGGIRAPSTQPTVGKPIMGDVVNPTTQPEESR